MLFAKRAPVAWLVAGLGNPGDQYEHTRHNAGFQVIDALSQRGGFPVRRLKFHALTQTALIGGQGVLVMKPLTYMNLSGQAGGGAPRFYKLPPPPVLITPDDVDLPLGKLRIRKGGSAGGHNGLKSVIQHLGTDQFPRLKVGVGRKPHPDYDMADWVLGQFQGADRTAMDQAADQAAQAVECLLAQGIDRAMNRFN